MTGTGCATCNGEINQQLREMCKSAVECNVSTSESRADVLRVIIREAENQLTWCDEDVEVMQ